MNAHKRFGVLVAILASGFAVLACTCATLGIGAEPTATPLPTAAPLPTQPPPPTDAPPPTEPPAPPTKPAAEGAAQSALELLEVNGYLDSFNSINIFGLLQNNGDVPMQDITLQIDVYDSNDNLIYSDTAFSDAFTLLPGQQSTFSHTVFEELTDAARFEATVLEASTSESLPDSLPVDSQNVSVIFDDNGDAHITGELVSPSGEPVQIASISGALFDADDQLLATGTGYANISYLVPDRPGPFSIQLTSPATGFPDGGSWRLYVEAERPLDPPMLQFTLSELYDYRDGSNNLHVLGQVTNENAEAVTVRLIGTIYDSEGLVIDVATTDTPFLTISPGETVPYDLAGWDTINNTTDLIGTSMVVQVDYGWSWAKDDDTIVLDATGVDNNFDEFEGVFTGQVVNDSGGAVAGATVIVAFFDKATGELRGTGFDWIFDEIPAGGTADFEVRIPISEGFDISSASAAWIVKGDLP